MVAELGQTRKAIQKVLGVQFDVVRVTYVFVLLHWFFTAIKATYQSSRFHRRLKPVQCHLPLVVKRQYDASVVVSHEQDGHYARTLGIHTILLHGTDSV
jgi:hypothetical protein